MQSKSHPLAKQTHEFRGNTGTTKENADGWERLRAKTNNSASALHEHIRRANLPEHVTTSEEWFGKPGRIPRTRSEKDVESPDTVPETETVVVRPPPFFSKYQQQGPVDSVLTLYEFSHGFDALIRCNLENILIF